jgi:2-amino-4-hydroxy-6-hydroxymethyldihydropteridine diphosphokinase
MDEGHRTYLNLGSNIEAETNLPAVLPVLREFGEVRALSRAWESRAVGSSGPNFLNACALFHTAQSLDELRATTRSVETRLGRVRTEDVNAPRTIDIDIMMYDGQPLLLDRWEHPFVLVPLAELAPELPFPATGEPLRSAAERTRAQTWIVPRPDVELK